MARSRIRHRHDPGWEKMDAVSSILRVFFFSGTDRTNVCWIKEECKTLAPKSCSKLPSDVVEHVERFDSYTLNLHLNRGCLARDKPLDSQLNNAPASCNPPCFRITKPGEYCYIGTRNNNFSNRRHIGQITVINPGKWLNITCYNWVQDHYPVV